MHTVAIIGAGSVGTALAENLAAREGFEVRVGRRDPSDRDGLPDGVRVLGQAAAVRGASVVFLAVPAGAAVATARSLGLPGDGSVILADCTNPVRFQDGPVRDVPAEGSVTAALAGALPGVPVVKALSTFGTEIHRNPHRWDGAETYLAGGTEAAREALTRILTDAGFQAVDCGPERNAAHLEAMAILWIQLASTGMGREWVFGIRRPGKTGV